MKAREIYGKWLEQNETPVEDQLKFGDEWVKQWEAEYGVSLRKPNKHYTLLYDDVCIRLKDYLKNVWTVRNLLTANFIPEFVFKGKGTRIKLNPPEGMKVQWSDSGSYRLKHILQTIENLPNRNRNPFSKKDWAIYVLDNYAVQIMPEI